MGTEGRRAAPPLDRALFEESYEFDFFQAVRLLERIYSGRQAVGRGADPADEAMRFRSRLSLSFPPSEVHEITPATDGRPAEVTVSFMGFTGPLGVLPRHYTELLLERVRAKDATFQGFLDLFNHRFVSLFYRAWEKHHFPVGYERSELRREGHDPFTRGLLALVGMGTGGLLDRIDVHQKAIVFYGGLLGRHARSASALRGIVRGYFEVPVDVSQFSGEWLPIPETSVTRLGAANSALGVDAVVGSRFWDPNAKFTVEIGPVGFEEFGSFLPSGDAFGPLAQITRFFAGEELDFDVRLTLKAAEVPACKLGGPASRLGWSTWLKTKEFTDDASDAVFAGRREVVVGGASPADGSHQGVTT